MAIAAATTLLVGCSSEVTDSTAADAVETTAESISIEIARSPIPASGDTVTPVYGILVNDSLSDMRLISATSPLAASVNLLDPDDSVVLPAEGFVVRSDGGLVMEPVGYKLMLNGVGAVAIGQEIPVTLRLRPVSHSSSTRSSKKPTNSRGSLQRYVDTCPAVKLASPSRRSMCPSLLRS
jgi:copper(I)-binding protein